MVRGNLGVDPLEETAVCPDERTPNQSIRAPHTEPSDRNYAFGPLPVLRNTHLFILLRKGRMRMNGG